MTDALQQFLDSVTNKDTRNSYKRGITLFLEYVQKPIEQVLKERQEDLAIKPNEDLVTQKQRASRFERQYLEPFYHAMITKDSEFLKMNLLKGMVNKPMRNSINGIT